MDRPPHILFILTDQLRADCLGCAGHPLLETSNIDRLAAEGVRFANCFTTSPLCVPLRLSLTMGLYPGLMKMSPHSALSADPVFVPLA